MRICLNIMVIIHVYCPGGGGGGGGQMSPLGPIFYFFSESLIFSPTVHFMQDFHFK